VRERLGVVELRERCVGRVEMGAEDAPAIGASKLLRPKRIRLVLQDVAAHERERSVERAAGRVRRLMRRGLEELIEAVEIQLDKIGGEAIGLCFGNDELARPVTVRRETPPQHRDERLQRPGRILGLLISPEKVGEPIRRDAVSTRGEQDL
jgi:hypothetical protein